MSRVSPPRTQFDAPVEAELARWPGVTWTRRVRSRHFALVLTYNGASRFVTYSATCSDQRAIHRHISDIRHALKALGAEREREARSARERRRRSQVEAPARFQPRELTRLDADPLSRLEAVRRALVARAPFVLPIRGAGALERRP